MTPHIKQIKSNIAHWRSRYSETEKNNRENKKWETPIFAYLRRSTPKEEQRESLIQQEDGINSIVKKLGLGKEEIYYFAETFSGFENKKRKEWGKMLEQIDKLKTPCIILCRDISRLSRNPTDSQKIMDRVYWDNLFKKKEKILKIYSLDYDRIKEWDKNTDKEEMHKALSASYYDSLDTRRKSIGGILLKLESGEFPYHAPRGLEHIIVKWKKVLSQNDKMPFVRHAFEMKVERKGHKVIAKYLKQFWGIKIGEKELTVRYFTNTVYIGEYMEKTTGQVFGNLLFAEWKPPISITLWDKVQKSLSKRGRIYRNESEKDIFEERGCIEWGGLLARDIKKKQTKKGESTYTYYKNTKARVNIAQERILEMFKGELEKVIYKWSTPYILQELNFLKSSANKNQHVDLVNQEVYKFQKWFPHISQMGKLSKVMLYSFFEKVQKTSEERKQEAEGLYDKFITDSLAKLFVEHPEFEKDRDIYEKGMDAIKYFSLKESLAEEENIIESSNDFLKTFFSLSPNIRESEEMRKAQKGEILKLEEQKKDLEEERKQYRKKAVLVGMSAEEIEDVSKEIDRSIRIIQEEIQNLWENTDMEDFLERLPKILSEIVELSSEALITEEKEKKKENIIKLFEITVSNFSVSNKKELKIKLFEVLDTLVNGDNVGMETPSGVEPDYGALQAPA